MTLPSYHEAITDWGKGEVILKVGEHTMKVDINKLMKYPSWASEDLGAIDFTDDQYIDAYVEEVMMIDEEAGYDELSIDEPSLELKTLPSTLKYAFLDKEKAKPVIILSKLDTKQEEQLQEVLRRNEDAIGRTLADLKGLEPSLWTHRIFPEYESRPVREAQRWLNPKVWEAVKEELLKWLNAEIIYPISNSQWLSNSRCNHCSKESRCSKESLTNSHDEWERRGDLDTPSEKIESLHWLSQAELCNEEGSLLAPVHRPNPRPSGRIELLLLPRWIFGLQPDCDSSPRSREDDVHMSFWHIHPLTMYDGNLLWLSWRQLRSFHGWLQHLWKWHWELSCSPNQDPGGLRQETTGASLGKIPLHGTWGSSVRAHHLRQRTRGGQGQDTGHPKPPSSRYYIRFGELSWACRLLPEIHTKLCQSLPATHHPSLKR